MSSMNKDLNEAHRAAIEEVAAIWREARRPIAMTGAGVSVPSGIPDFRSPGGLWERYRPEEVATLQALRATPEKVWRFLLDADHIFSQAAPNPAHQALAALEQAGRLRGVITQNIDGLHQRAGSSTVVEFHGCGQRYYCMGCKKDFDPALVRKLTPADIPWRCEDCDQVIRPDFVFFNEQIPAAAMESARLLTQNADLAVIAGTSGEVAPANSLPLLVKQRGGRVIEINLGRTHYEAVADVRITAPAEEVLPMIRDLLLC